MSQRNVCYIVFSSRHRAQIDCRREGDCSGCHRETFATSCFHRDTEPKSIAAEKEIVRDVTEKRLLHRVFIATQSPNRLHDLPDGTFSLLAPNAPVARSIVPSSLREGDGS